MNGDIRRRYMKGCKAQLLSESFRSFYQGVTSVQVRKIREESRTSVNSSYLNNLLTMKV